MRVITLLILVTGWLAAAITNVRVEATAQQAVIRYTVSNSGACTIEVREDSQAGPVVHDVDGTLFAGSNSDSGGTRARTFVAGKRAVATAANGRRYSRSLEADRTHWYQISCGADSVTGTFRTKTIPWGNSHSDVYPSDGSGGYLWPSIDYTTRQKYIDPLTGVAMWPVMMPRDYTSDGQKDASDCYGTNWTGLSPCSATTSDSVYASSSTIDRLTILYGITSLGYGHSGIDAMDYIQFQITGYGAGTLDSERTVNVCLTRDNGQTCSASRQVILPATNGTVAAGSGTAGDFWENEPWNAYEKAPGKGWIRTGSETPDTNVTFTDSSDCGRLRTDSKIFVYPDASTTRTTLTIQSLSCPNAVVDTAVNLYNGGLGVPFTTPGGLGVYSGSTTIITPNLGFGLQIWKANNDGQAVFVDSAAVVVGRSPTFAKTAAGFHNQCSAKDAANGGWYKCFAERAGNPYTPMYAIRKGNDGDPEIRRIGRAKASWGTCNNLSPAPINAWSDDPNTWVAVCSDELVKVVFSDPTYSEAPAGSDASFATTSLTSGNTITDLLLAFRDANGVNWDPYYASFMLETIQGPWVVMVARMGNQDTAAYMAILDTGNKLPIGAGWQGTHGGTNPFATDGTGFVAAMTSLFDRTNSRWCGLHTYEWVGNEPVVCPEIQTLNDTVFGGGYYRTVLKTAMASCTKGTTCTDADIHVQSTWDTTTWRTPGWTPTTISTAGAAITTANMRYHVHAGSQIQANVGGAPETRTVTSVYPALSLDSAFSSDLSGAPFQYTFPTAPGWWRPGDPIGDRAPWALARIKPGDAIQIGNERVRVLSVTANPSDLTLNVERGVNFNNGATVSSHNIDTSAYMYCNIPYANYWYFTKDRTAGGTTFYASYDVLGTGHGTYSNGMRVQADYRIQVDRITDYFNWNRQTHSVDCSPQFGGKTPPCNGNSYQKHPSSLHFEATGPLARTFFDVLPLMGTNLLSPQSNSAAQRVAGFTHVYKYTYTEQGRAIERKHFATFGKAGARNLRDISGPGSSISDADRYTVCVADVAGECVPGSTQGSIYLNIPNLVQSFKYCGGGETSFLTDEWDDACSGELPMLGQAVVQVGVFRNKAVGVSNVKDNEHGRVLVTMFQPWRQIGIFANTKPLPDGSFAQVGALDKNRTWYMIGKAPSLGSDDLVNRRSFVPVAVNLNPPAALGVDNAVVEFGYDPSFYCTSRAEACVASSSALNESNPFTWPAEAGGESNITGVPCSAGCTIQIPALSQRVLYYRWKYRAANNSTIVASDTSIVAVP